MIIGQHKRSFELKSYQSDWITHFNNEASLLQATLGDKAQRIEHIGSTSIPGMAAKAIIDIMVAIPSLDRSSELILGLDNIGYTYKPIDTIPERVYLSKEIQPEIRTHHLSLVVEGSEFWNNHLLFRDYLRDHEQLAIEYVQLKEGFADYYQRTNHVDIEWKSAFVAKVLKLARTDK